MPEYKVEVTTGDSILSATWNNVFVTIYGSEGQSERKPLDNWGRSFRIGVTDTYTVTTLCSLGDVLLLKVEKESGCLPLNDQWYCSKIVVTTPEGKAILFPCYKWISTGQHVELRGGRAMKVFEDQHPLLKNHRRKELSSRKSFYRWTNGNEFQRGPTEGLPGYIDVKDESELPAEICFSLRKKIEIGWALLKIGVEIPLTKMLGFVEKFESTEDIKKIFFLKSTVMSEYVAEHWKEDDFFGYQFLNGVNPNRIQRCSELPKNFPVTEKMVEPFLREGSSLMEEMEKGHIFLYDQKKMDGIPGRDYNGEPLQVTPGLCLFYLNPENKLMPIAIQLQQQPSEKNPIFLPSDSETDWLLAKMFIKNVDALDHESVHHLMNTHFLSEVFAIATLRCLPEIHPLHKLLIPHFRDTLHINIRGRPSLLGPAGPLSMSSLGYEGILELMRRSLLEVTYSSLCLPENIAARGLDSIPDFFYRDDGLKLWNIIHCFVKGMVSYYYPSDTLVQMDTELQDWISEIFTHGFLGNRDSGFPKSFQTAEEVIKFITVVIFTTSVQHAAVNNGQFDFCAFAPNAPILLRKPPPTTKGQTSQETILETLPNVAETIEFATMVFILSEKYTDQVALGTYPEQRFDERAPEKLIQRFQLDLRLLSEAITKRNVKLDIPYTYLEPSLIENSVSI